MQEIVHIAEIGSTAVAAAVAASHLGLNQVPMLMIVFFSVTLGGQALSAVLARTSAAPAGKRERGE
jgi:hypothetical protein